MKDSISLEALKLHRARNTTLLALDSDYYIVTIQNDDKRYMFNIYSILASYDAYEHSMQSASYEHENECVAAALAQASIDVSELNIKL